MRGGRKLVSDPQVTSRAQRRLAVLSSTEITSDTDLDLVLGEEITHIPCCQINQFFCEHPYHPELISDDNHPGCATCMDINLQFMCPRYKPTHMHCPFTGYVCPPEPV